MTLGISRAEPRKHQAYLALYLTEYDNIKGIYQEIKRHFLVCTAALNLSNLYSVQPQVALKSSQADPKSPRKQPRLSITALFLFVLSSSSVVTVSVVVEYFEQSADPGA